MEGATHFIEVFASLDETVLDDLFTIDNLSLNLSNTEKIEGLTTIAIFKIKLKPQPHGQLHS